MSDIVSANIDENNTNLIQNKKSRGRPKLTEDEKQKRKEELKAYKKTYSIEHKDDIKKYHAERYSKDILERNKFSSKLNYEILNFLRELYMNQLITINDKSKENEFKKLLNKKYKNILS